MQRDPPSSDAVTVAVTANNAFATDLFSRVAAGQAGQNVLTSPVSASLALAMTYAGARGDTATQMAKALHFDPTAGIADAENALSQELATVAPQALAADKMQSPETPPSPDDYRLDVVNSVWGQQGTAWASPFLDVLGKSYGAGVNLEDFVHAPDAARAAINSWVSTQTADKINDLLPSGSIDAMTRVVLVNAIHLKLPWVEPFDPSQTAPGAFTKGDGTTVQASFMTQGHLFDYGDDGKAQVATFSLAGFGAKVLLAMPHGDLATYEAELAADPTEPFEAFDGTEATVHVPKVDFTSPSFSLESALGAMGMTDAFTDAADFSGMDGAKDIVIADVLQKAMISLAETGVEAAAATAVIGEALDAPSKIANVTFDHPFVIVITDPKGAILFLGHVADPTQGS
ncbi:MAG TPA: serpin family protein [Polyangiaceae bacterium]|nr:serpin family protein [Polyangiaceae bacterium]